MCVKMRRLCVFVCEDEATSHREGFKEVAAKFRIESVVEDGDDGAQRVAEVCVVAIEDH